MKGISVLPDNPNFVPEGTVQYDDSGEPFAVLDLDGLPGWANLNVGALPIEAQRRYLVALSLAAERLAVELNAHTRQQEA